ncbi:MAG: 16S rRNA (guanine(966)-N(2))-methyltransferase RsmD [Candidatus Marinimicrobia bacterium]|jgi:16S rRNA (guanine966-N2)-methyltransferase|nr:16S rRNA (guanine(966)-N(2))-methyltransferase RsmD [Candidatus Neomarinimicrobiota bacterium]MCK9483468.1 16S rRNA (guanine(966)-N(2))-methyltransferase RsmD [Candidatus Neomarinimicrobiota bacterium]MCK9560516.1 16S rRNA (guanine(966)-N(2))-methyltransferase RsmD [Candidatus Neomarinimicrobiota bacterium]MDD5061317.1 16S rRNA (guanine(966)-N(2))-methyltransferase RsmD [Candidatus Neomarinimicrobiota bacterium]
MVRVIAGLLKSRSINYGKRNTIRPTQDRVKAALFSIMGDIADQRVADLFAGTGNLGIEALSRGAASCTFVENDPQNVALIRQNLTNLGLEAQAEIVQKDALKFLEAKPEFNLILADPPYNYPFYSELLTTFQRLTPGTRIVLETDIRYRPPASFRPNDLKIRKSGDTNLIIIRI